MAEYKKQINEYTCPFDLYKDMIRTDPKGRDKWKNHSLTRKEDGYQFIEWKSEFIENAIDDLKLKTDMVVAGLHEFSPSELLLFEFLKKYGFKQAFRQIEYNNEKRMGKN